MFAAWSGDGQETTRHTFEGLAEIHLGVLIMFLYVMLARVPKTQTRQVGDVGVGASTTP
jgi:hypothetical protein